MTDFVSWGATPDDWNLFDLVLGLTEDLLPCVSNPNAVIAPPKTLASGKKVGGTLKSLGKVPSLYNSDRLVVGIANWTGKRSNTKQISAWQRESDYGICIQTRLVRAFDIDVGDFYKSSKISEFIEKIAGFKFPARSRSNSGKFLLAFRLPGEFGKRRLAVDGGIIEFLATGQQFVAAGTHTSGTRYQLEWNGFTDFPLISAEQFETIWTGLVSEFGIAPPVEGGLRKPKGAASGIGGVVASDLVAAHLISSGAILAEGSDGQLFITCPWKDEHTSDSGETETAYFPAGTRGYQQGHFACLHAHCAGRMDEDYRVAFGCGIAEDFKNLDDAEYNSTGVHGDGENTQSKAALLSARNLPPFVRKKDGAIPATINNLTLALSRPDVCQWHIGFDEFRDEIMYYPINEPEQWRQLGDADYVRLREYLEQEGFDPIGREIIRDAVLRVADDNRFDSAQSWLSKLTWDKVDRVKTFLNSYLGAVSNDYTSGVSLYIWSALAGRILKPGVKADMVPILLSAQGTLKSTGVSVLAPNQEFFVTLKLDDKDDNNARLMRGRLIVELPELSGLHTRELEAIKAFITRTHESWIPKFREFATTFPRRCLFFGTTNNKELFVDETGNRRWLPVECKRADVEALTRDREQLWAEGAALYQAHGVMWQEAEKLAPQVHEQHMVIDTWMEEIDAYLHRPVDITDRETPASRGWVTIKEILRDCLNVELRNINKALEQRVAKSLRKLGYEKSQKRLHGKGGVKIWTLKEFDSEFVAD